MDLLIRAVQSALTLYMLMILVRMTASWLELDLKRPWLRLIPMATDPLIRRVHAVLPNLGPFDFSPIVTLLLVGFVRWLSWGLITLGR